ncbi:hypothetical protein HHK36_019784 [Tetracentron sinense]|uniref:Uncharacterized protein n=1 Tax=Tetracentron sinense TaxID=13715 RepID=A0A834YXZ5_TETSI|nr:hypothetical protein HHK36_019784 [Tetracentron sinense]
MGKYAEILDVGVRIAARFHSHCPHTARMYYHPPANADDHRLNHDDGTSGGKSADEVSNRRGNCGPKAAMGVDTRDFVIYWAVPAEVEEIAN